MGDFEHSRKIEQEVTETKERNFYVIMIGILTYNLVYKIRLNLHISYHTE